MAAIPILEESNAGPSGALLDSLGGWERTAPPAHIDQSFSQNRPLRNLAIYPASAGFDMIEELEFLCARSVEPNVFFNPRFLAPAMPRLEDREVRLAVIRDGDDTRSRLRLLVPFSIERPTIPMASPHIRAWASPFGPLGTPLVDMDDPVGVMEDFFSMLARPHLNLPKVFAFPDIRLDGPFADILRSFCEAQNLAFMTTSAVERPFLKSSLDGDSYLRETLRAHHFREFRRLKRRLEAQGKLEHRIARSADEVRLGVEAFLALEAAGWKGREGSAMAIDRFRAAFAREATHSLAQRDLCRVHQYLLDGRPIACVIVFVENGIAYTWKTAYDEALAAFSPGTLLMLDVTRSHLDDPNIMGTDSCAVPDHPVMSRIWGERRPVGTVVVGLTPHADKAARQAAAHIQLRRDTRNLARLVRGRMRSLLSRRKPPSQR